MQKYKKLFGVLLSVLMVLSAVSVGLVAMAQEPDGAVSALEAKITAFNGNMDTATPTDADKAAYDELVSGFKALTDEQKNSIDIVALDKLTQLMYTYQCAVASNGSSYVPSATRKDVSKAIVAELNAPDLNAAQAAVDDGILSAAADKAIELFKGLSYNARVIAGTAYSSYGLFYYGMNADSNYQAGAFYNLVNKIFSDVKKADPYPTDGRPSSGDYDGGSKDPQYVADYRAYNLAKNAHEDAQLLEAINQAVEKTGATEYAGLANYIKEASAAVQAFKTNKDYQPSIKALETYNALDVAAQNAVRGLRCYACTYAEYTTETSTSPKHLYARELTALVSDYAKYADIAAFETYIQAIDEPYTYAIYEEARAKYDALPQSFLGELSAESAAKIDAITYYGLTHAQSTETPEFPAFTRTAVTYPSGASYDKVTSSIPKMNTLVQQIVSLVNGSDLQATIQGLYTNASVSAVAQAIGPLLNSLGIGTVNPSHLLNRMATANEDGTYTAINPEWQGAVDALKQAVDAGDVWVDDNPNDNIVKGVNYKDGDWFLDGDKEGFSRAIAQHLTLLMEMKVSIINVGSMLFSSLQFENEYDFEDNTYEQGSYENIVHIFEALGIPCMDSVTYSEAVDAAQTDDEKIVARFAPILDAVFDFLDTFAAAPVTTLLDFLPNLATALNNGTLNDNVQAIVGRISGLLGLAGVQLPTLDFTAEGIFDTLGGLGLEGISYDPGSVNSSGVPNYPNTGSLSITIEMEDASSGTKTPVTLTIQEADFIQFCKDMAGCGEQVVTDSICLDSAKRVTIDADQADAFVTLVRFVYDDVLMKNTAAVKEIINSMNAEVGSLLGPVIDVIQQVLPADAAIVALVTIADPLAGTGDIGGGLDDIGSIFDQIRDFFANLFNGGVDLGDVPIIGDIVDGIGGLFGGSDDTTTSGDGTEQTGDPNIPAGGSVAGAVTSAIALAAGAAIVLGAVKVRRSREEDM